MFSLSHETITIVDIPVVADYATLICVSKCYMKSNNVEESSFFRLIERGIVHSRDVCGCACDTEFTPFCDIEVRSSSSEVL